MSIMDELVSYASEAGAEVADTPDGHSMSWNGGLYAHHLWRTDDEWFYGYSERGRERVPTMWSPYDQLTYKWAASRIAIDARAALELPAINLPNTDRADGMSDFGRRTNSCRGEGYLSTVPAPRGVFLPDSVVL